MILGPGVFDQQSVGLSPSFDTCVTTLLTS